MPCDYTPRPEQTLQERMSEVDRAVARLRESLATGRVQVRIGPTGAIAFQGWDPKDRAGLSDACTYRVMTVQGSWELRQAVARAELTQGRKVNAQAIAAGVHSHDGGKSWGRD